MAHRTASLGAVLCALLIAGSGACAEDAEELDADFLEFLGSLDSDDEAWDGILTAAANVEGELDEAADGDDAKRRKKVKDDDGS